MENLDAESAIFRPIAKVVKTPIKERFQKCMVPLAANYFYSPVQSTDFDLCVNLSCAIGDL
jgi:hypothetical protein